MKLSQLAIDRVVGVFDGLDLGDPRRTARLRSVVQDLARDPFQSLPWALGNGSKLQGAYRLVNNPRVTFEKLMEHQFAETARRAGQAGSVLVVHDTTDCAFPDIDPEELGYLQTGKAGFYAHFSLVLDANEWRRPIGVIAAETIHREKRSKRGRGRKAPGGETHGWADREALRWVRGMEAAGSRLKNCQNVIHLADREGDSYELMDGLVRAAQRFVIRVRVRARRGRSPGRAGEWSTVEQVAERAAGVVEREVPLTRRRPITAPQSSRLHPPRKMRTARLRFSAGRVEIPRPSYLKAPVSTTLSLNLVRVFEVDVPAGEPPVEWLLYTTEPVDTAEQVETVVDAYRTRWTIEEFNAALKTGCAFEQREFESRHALLAMLAISIPIACEVLWLRSRARSTPDAPATEVLSPKRLELLRVMGTNRLPAKNPTVQDALLAVAGIVGHMKNNGAPGWKILSRGMLKLLSFEAGWDARIAFEKLEKM